MMQLFFGEGEKFKTVQKAIENSYEAQEFDEFIKPIVITDENSEAIGNIKDDDTVIFFNFRSDRGRELTRAIIETKFDKFERKGNTNNIKFVTMTEYDKTFDNIEVVYKRDKVKNTLGEYLSKNRKTQLRIAETEKYAHVTFFFNGGEEKKYNGEERILIQSPKVSTYDEKPEMSAYEITDKVMEAIDSKKFDVIILNYANGDMVGHTGNLEKAIEGLEAVDKCVGKVISKLEEVEGEAIITADHGNCEEMIDLKTGDIITSHTTNPVPVILISKRVKSLTEGGLRDVPVTLLDLMGMEIPKEMTGRSLINF